MNRCKCGLIVSDEMTYRREYLCQGCRIKKLSSRQKLGLAYIVRHGLESDMALADALCLENRNDATLIYRRLATLGLIKCERAKGIKGNHRKIVLTCPENLVLALTPEVPVIEEKKDEGTERRCLMCRNSFMSEWVGERVCRKCKDTDRWRTAV